MASRIDEEEYEGTRLHQINPDGQWESNTIRFCVDTNEISPIIARGNIFDGITAEL